MVKFEVTKQTPKIRFLASLSDGRTVIEDKVPGKENAWFRLQKYLQQNPHIKITGLRLQDVKRNTIVNMPSNQRGYFLSKKQIKVFPGGSEVKFMGLGYYDGNMVTVRWLKQPGLQKSNCETKTKAQAGSFLIVNPKES